MDHFEYRGGVLFAESLSITDLAEKFGTPLYVYSTRTLADHFHRTQSAFSQLSATICFSVKSCSNLSILRLLGSLGSSFDVVSGGEFQRVMEAVGDPKRIVFAGVGKSDDELLAALRAGIGWFNVESEQEMENLSRLSQRQKTRARVALRINPDVDPKTHIYTTTGTRETKFGVDFEVARRIFYRFGRDVGIELCGIHVHIGSPVNSIEPYVQAIEKTLDFIRALRAEGYDIRAINIGGGFGAHYQSEEAPPASEYAARIIPLIRDQNLQVFLEPGRSIVANAGVLIARVIYTKPSGDRMFAILDAAMTDLIRPALYGAFHFAWPVAPAGGDVPQHRGKDIRARDGQLVDLVGPVCESSDFLAKERYLPHMKRGDLVCLFTAGAYGFSMSSQYNSRPRVAEVLVNGTDARLIRRRETFDDLVAAERE